jgi:hypothetical protein
MAMAAREKRLDGFDNEAVDGLRAFPVRLADQSLHQLGIAANGFEGERFHVRSFQLRLTAASPPSEFTSAIPACCSR